METGANSSKYVRQTQPKYHLKILVCVYVYTCVCFCVNKENQFDAYQSFGDFASCAVKCMSRVKKQTEVTLC